MEAIGLLDLEFGTLDGLVASHAASRPTHPALVHDEATLDYRGLDLLADRVAAALQRDGIGRTNSQSSPVRGTADATRSGSSSMVRPSQPMPVLRATAICFVLKPDCAPAWKSW